MLKLKSPPLQRLYDDWNMRRRGRAFPSRADFDPIDFKYILGRLSLLDVLGDPVRFRYRVHGSDIVARFGVDLTRRYVDEAPSRGHREAALEDYGAAVVRREPIVMYRGHQFIDARTWGCEILVLPLSDDGDTVQQLFSGLAW